MSIEPRDLANRIQTVTDLERTHHLIQKGWCQNAAHRRTFLLGRTQYCATGALARACDVKLDQLANDRAIYALTALFMTVFPGSTVDHFMDNCKSLQVWNDDPARTKAQVLLALNRAIQNVQAGRI